MNGEVVQPWDRWGASLLMTSFDERNPAGELRNLDAAALGQVYDRHAEAVYKYVRYRLNDARLAEDVTSEVFLALLEALQRGGGPRSNVKAWLLSTAAHMVTDHIRRAYRRPTEILHDEHPDPGLAPREEFDRRQQRRDFVKAYGQLTPEQQHVLALRFGDGLSLEETAAVINKKANAVKALQFRAMQALQRNLSGSDDG